MAGNIFRRLTGSHSRSSREAHENENEAENEDNNDNIPPNTEEQTAEENGEFPVITLSEDPTLGVWWDDQAVNDYVTKSFTRTYDDDYVTKWSDASKAKRNKMFAYFANHIKPHDRGYNLRGEWETRVKRRITQVVCNAAKAKKKPWWQPGTHWEMVKKMSDNPDFAKLSKVNKTNRRSGGVDGKALGTHTLGRKSSATAFKELGTDATPYQLMERSKKKKDGQWVNPRAVETNEAYQKEMSQPTPTGVAPDPFQVYNNVVGGYNNRSRFFGLGSAAPQLFEPTRGKHQPSGSSYAPSIIAQFSQENSQLKEHMSKMQMDMQATQERQELMEAFMRERFNFSGGNNTCSGFREPYRRDDHTDDGQGFTEHVEPLG